MPALPPVAKVVRCDFFYTDSSDMAAQTREFFAYTGTLNAADAATWLGVIVSALQTFVAANLNNDTKLVRSELTDLSSNTAPQVSNSNGATGAAAGSPLTAGAALVIKKEILRRYRGGKARVYWPGVTSALLTDPRTFDPTALGTFVGHYQSWINTCIGGTIPAAVGTATHVNVSYFQGYTNHMYPSGRVKPIPNQRAVPVVDPIIATVGNPIVASQRRRNEQP